MLYVTSLFQQNFIFRLGHIAAIELNLLTRAVCFSEGSNPDATVSKKTSGDENPETLDDEQVKGIESNKSELTEIKVEGVDDMKSSGSSGDKAKVKHEPADSKDSLRLEGKDLDDVGGKEDEEPIENEDLTADGKPQGQYWNYQWPKVRQVLLLYVVLQ